jgi:heme-degrading monooxygenase HmoA
MKDLNDECTFFTISHWNSEDDLESYRNSYLFKNIWSKVKPLFAKKAEAWSLSTII